MQISPKKRFESFIALKSKAFRHPDFDDPAMESVILGPIPEQEEYERKYDKIYKDRLNIGIEYNSFYQRPLLNRAQEQHLFKKMNFFKYRAEKILENITENPTHQQLDEVEAYFKKAREVGNQIAEANFRLTGQMLKRINTMPNVQIDDVLSDGNMDILHAIEKFNYNLGNKFSTYATWALIKNFGRHRAVQNKYFERFPSGMDDTLDDLPAKEESDETEPKDLARKRTINRLFCLLKENLKNRDSRSSPSKQLQQNVNRQIYILSQSFGLQGEERTLEDLGKELKISKERVRQIKANGLAVLRTLAAENNLSLD